MFTISIINLYSSLTGAENAFLGGIVLVLFNSFLIACITYIPTIPALLYFLSKLASSSSMRVKTYS